MRIQILSPLLFISLFLACNSGDKFKVQEESTFIPDYLIGNFEDDYEIQYSVTDSSFILLPNSVYHIKEWDINEQYFIAQNDNSNSYDPSKWSRIDWIQLSNMEPYVWAFCLSIYNAESAEEAKQSDNIEPESPKTGCNNFPFSRMKIIDSLDTNIPSY